MRVERVSLQGVGRCNEDALVERPDAGLYGVLDGATPLTAWTDGAGRTSGALAAAVVRQHLEESPAGLSLPQMLLGANVRLREVMAAHGVDVTDKRAVWACAAVLVRVTSEGVEWCQAGDCMAYAIYDNGVRELTRDSVSRFDSRTLSAFLQAGRQRTAAVDAVLHSNRVQANSPDGYSALNGDPDLARYLEYGRVHRMGLRQLLLISDGLMWPEPDPAQPPYELMVQAIQQKGLQAYAERLVEQEQNDPDLVQYPRLKPSDDKTGLWIDLT